MTGWVWAGIFIGLAIVILAVGMPYLLMHKGMHSADDVAEGQEYLPAKRRWGQRQGPHPGQADRGGQQAGHPLTSAWHSLQTQARAPVSCSPGGLRLVAGEDHGLWRPHKAHAACSIGKRSDILLRSRTSPSAGLRPPSSARLSGPRKDRFVAYTTGYARMPHGSRWP